jgi:ribosomal-protein-alanine N-acetyltransferase
MIVPPLLIEAAGDDDLPELLALEGSSFSNPWTAEHFRQELGRPERGRVLVMRTADRSAPQGRRIVAYVVFQTVADELHVLNLAVRGDLRRRGLGRRLLRLVSELGLRRGAEVVWLEVRRGNRAGIGLYQAEGFEQTGLRRGYYANPDEDAVVLRKRLSPADP